MGVTKPCTKTKRWYAKTVALSSFSLQVNRNSMPKKDSRMSPPAAKLAVRPVKPAVLPAVRARCTTPSALNAESPLRFLSSRERIVPYTAASALLPAADNQEGQLKPPKGVLVVLEGPPRITGRSANPPKEVVSCFGEPTADHPEGQLAPLKVGCFGEPTADHPEGQTKTPTGGFCVCGKVRRRFLYIFEEWGSVLVTEDVVRELQGCGDGKHIL